ncbi:4-carboxymuconolactone decarboxylase [Phycisphaerales bacterium]|nr:4-carboxymuconolactone decarboxylase [Phycisphaerales bacterium]
MSQEAAKFYETWGGRMGAVKARSPDLGRAFAPFFQALMKEGALSVKQKELIALGIGIAARCEACVMTHVEKCLKAGATPQEVMEAAGVAVMMGGGPAYTTTAKVVEALEYWEAKMPGAG